MSLNPLPLGSLLRSQLDRYPFPPFEGRARGPDDPGHNALSLVERHGAARGTVEAMIRERFERAYQARVVQFMPRLLALQGDDGVPLAACGLRHAESHPLFLERYLDVPVEAAIGAACDASVTRRQIIEVGQFAGSGAGAFRNLIVRLTAMLHREGQAWVVFTGTIALRNAFSRLGLAPRELGPAEPTRLDEAEREHWGSYYAHSPRVLCGNVGEGFLALTSRATRDLPA
ncbi:thermostable hemolysin [Cognatazoarcus halotolerans]|uniref:thermostable hemolysin n=1 Tax=Cognatazoarcus halotolerans TaxID=2686016 RepID=UPI001359F51F|nr:thermostable hemolysin [Cognatazoarcus halotolerans]MCB1900935.1 thermostable hemolysin [Rhodocyclaceae bacterium]MCP5310173.1 thermostable hemolysin [Zoogloeaceae bacterium]